MNRSGLIQLLADRFSQLTQEDADSAVTAILDSMNNALARGNRIEIRGFSSFTVVHRAPRLGRNPRNGAAADSAFQGGQSFGGGGRFTRKKWGSGPV